MVTAILKCSCKSDYQDEKYGEKMRVHNAKSVIKQDGSFRCTVCTNINNMSSSDAKAKDNKKSKK